MHVAVCIERPDPRAGGAERASFGLVDYLRGAGHRVTILCRASQRGAADAIPVPERGPGKGRRVRSYARHCVAALAALAPDVSLATGKELGTTVAWPHGGVHAVSVARSLAARGWWARLKQLAPKQAVFRALEREIYAQPGLRAVIAVSPRVARDLDERFGIGARVRTIPNGVDLARFRPNPARRAATRAALGLEGRWGLHVAHQKRLKGLDLLLAALREVPGLGLLIVGRGARRPFASALAALGPRVRWLGERDDLPALYRAADLFCHPTRYDPCPLVTLEALASGLPVVTSPEDGVAEALGAAGRVCAALRPDAVARALREALDPDWQAAAVVDARRLAEERFSATGCFERIAALLEELRER